MLRNTALSILLLSVLLLVGCGRAREAEQAVQAGRQLQQSGETIIKTDEGEVHIKTGKAGEQATITVEGESGEKHSVTVGEDFDASGLSLAIYPGATKQHGQVLTTDQGKQLRFTFTTTDSFDEVADFYRDKYSDAKIFDIETLDVRALNIVIAAPPETTAIFIQQADDEAQVTFFLVEQN